MTHERAVRAAFPELTEIVDETLRERIVQLWSDSLADSAFDSVHDIPWWPPYVDVLEEPVSLVTHVRDVTGLVVTLVDAVQTQFNVELDRDTAVAAGLLHDVSKVFELDTADTTTFNEYLPHPHYGLHMVAEAGFSRHLQHIVISHSKSSAVEPRTFEAVLLQVADGMAANARFMTVNGTLKP
jgi:hypothetical protein